MNYYKLSGIPGRGAREKGSDVLRFNLQQSKQKYEAQDRDDICLGLGSCIVDF